MNRLSTILKTIKRLRDDQSGTILILTLFSVVLFMILTVGVVEYGKYRIYTEKMQTATDAASLAGATTGIHRWVKLRVYTDRGDETYCYSCGDGDTCCSCRSCGIATRNTPWMEEKDLIEGGDWKMFCYPSCDCSAGDCWFEILDRKVTYDITSREEIINSQDVQGFQHDMTAAVKEALSAKAYPYSGRMAEFIRGRSLSNISSILARSSTFAHGWADRFWYSWIGDYSPSYYDYLNEGYRVYYQVANRKEWVDRVIDSINNYASLLDYSGSGVAQRQADDAADYYYMLNAPVSSDISRVVVHGKEDDPYYPSVTVYARGYMPTVLTDLMARLTDGVNRLTHLRADTCSQGDTYYYSPSSQAGQHKGPIDDGKWRTKPAESCWLD